MAKREVHNRNILRSVLDGELFERERRLQRSEVGSEDGSLGRD